MAINVSKALKEIATNRNTIVNETKQLSSGLGRGLSSGSDPAKALNAFMENNKNNPAVIEFMKELKPDIGSKPTAIHVVSGIDSKLNNYVPRENDPIHIVTNSGIKTVIPKDLPPDAIKGITRLFGEPKLWNSNKGISVGDVDTYGPKLTDELVAAYNNAIKNPEILELYKGKPFNKELLGKILYNGIAAGSWGSAGFDATQVVNRANGIPENGNPDSILTNPYAIAGMAALTRGVFPLAKPVAKLLGNPGVWGIGADLILPAAVAKVVNKVTASNTDQNATNATNADSNTITVDALNNSNKGNTSLAEDSWNLGQ